MIRSLFSVLHKSAVFSFATFYTKPTVRSYLSDQHRDIMSAILAGDAKLAREKMQTHILSIDKLLRENHQENVRNKIIKSRLHDLNQDVESTS